MSDIPNYSTYHLDELKSALSNIDETSNPEEAKIIRNYIAKGGYSYPSSPAIEKVTFVSQFYKWSLILILSFLLLENTLALIGWHMIMALIPIVIQSTLLYLIFKNHKLVRGLIKIWCFVLLISAFSRFLELYYSLVLDYWTLFDGTSSLFIGLYYLVFSDKSIHLIPYYSNN